MIHTFKVTHSINEYSALLFFEGNRLGWFNGCLFSQWRLLVGGTRYDKIQNNSQNSYYPQQNNPLP
jgi:hypothetical protein